MSPDPGAAQQLHRLQGASHTCVVACARMVLAKHNHDVSEAELIVRWEGRGSPRGYPLRCAAEETGLVLHSYLELSDPAHIRLLQEALKLGWGIFQAFGGPLHVLARERVPPSRSPYGAVCGEDGGREQLWSQGLPLHALVLAGLDDEGAEVLDPWFPALDQPFRIAWPDLVHLWAGPALLPRLPLEQAG